MEKDSADYVQNYIIQNIKNNFEEETIYIIISQDIMLKFYMEKNILIVLKSDLSGLDTILCKRFHYFNFESMFLSEIEQRKNSIFYQKIKINFSLPLNYIDFLIISKRNYAMILK